MAKTSIFQKFVRTFWKDAKIRYPYITRFETPFCVAIPKSSSFIVGKSPRFHTHVVIDFQHSPKPWATGQFTINAHISEKFEPLERFYGDNSEDYEEGRDGYYRLATATGSKDRWWCLVEDKPDPLLVEAFGLESVNLVGCASSSRSAGNWYPSSYDDEATVIHEAIDDVCRFLEKSLLERYGFEEAQQAGASDGDKPPC